MINPYLNMHIKKMIYQYELEKQRLVVCGYTSEKAAETINIFNKATSTFSCAHEKVKMAAMQSIYQDVFTIVEARIIQEAGIPIVTALSKIMHLSLQDTLDAVKANRITPDLMIDAFKSLMPPQQEKKETTNKHFSWLVNWCLFIVFIIVVIAYVINFLIQLYGF